MSHRSFLKARWVSASVLALTTIAAFSTDQVDFSFITDKGWMRFTAGGDWKVLQMNTKGSVRAALFQIPNQADEGTPDSTNVAVTLHQINSPEASAGIARARQKFGKGTKSRIGPWEVFVNDFKQGDTAYLGRVAFRDVADVHLSVTFAWPHLSKNAVGYDSTMEQTFRALLNSITGALGKYPERKGDVLRHPL